MTALRLLLLIVSTAWAGTTPPDPVVISAGQVTRRSVELVWTAPGDDGSVGQAAAYDVRYSLIGPVDTLAKFLAATQASGEGAPKAAGGSESFTLSGLSAATTYYFAMRSEDEVPNRSAVSNALTAVTSATSAPRAVGGVRGTRDEGAGDFIVRWSTVILYEDGTAVDEDFSRYTIWKAPSYSGTYAVLAEVSTDTFVHTDAGSLGAEAYYRVTAGDVHGSTSAVYSTVDNTSEVRVVFEAPDGSARVSVPAQAQTPLFEDSNGYGADLRIGWTRRAADETGRVLLSYDIATITIPDGADVSATFPQPGAVLTLVAPAGSPLDQMAIFRFNGVDYANLGGNVEQARDVEIGITETGRYRLQQSLRAAGFRITHLAPRKIFTPNGDGINDTIAIHYENPATDVVSGEIFDVTGSRVASLRRGPTSDSLMWDGRDSAGNSARVGVYIYQLTGGGETSRGTVVLIR